MSVQQIRWRCIHYFLRGTLFLRPIPYHRDYRCWSEGLYFSSLLIVLSIPATLIAIGYFVGRYSQ